MMKMIYIYLTYLTLDTDSFFATMSSQEVKENAANKKLYYDDYGDYI